MTGATYAVSDAAGWAGTGWCATGATGATGWAGTGWYATGATGATGWAGIACLGLGIGAIAFLTLRADCERGGPFGLGLIEGPAGGPERGGPPMPEGAERGGTAACGGPAFGGADVLPPKCGREVGTGLLGACLCACG